MSKSNLVEPRFHGGDEAPELDNYRPISPMVIAACVASLMSFLAILHPLLWVVPIVAVVISGTAIARVSSAHSRSSGRGAAVCALCFAVLVGSYAPARSISRDRAISAQTRAKAEDWISLIQQGRVQEAHQLSMTPAERFQGPGLLDTHYTDVPPTSSSANMQDDPALREMEGPSPAKMLEEFVGNPPIAKLLEYGTAARIEHVRGDMIQPDFGGLKITQHYRASRVHDGQSESFDFLIRAARRDEKESANWTIAEIELVH